jgi:hypothetical protein
MDIKQSDIRCVSVKSHSHVRCRIATFNARKGSIITARSKCHRHWLADEASFRATFLADFDQKHWVSANFRTNRTQKQKENYALN